MEGPQTSVITLHPWQEPHAQRAEHSLRTRGRFADASDTGTGKTVIACTLAKRMGLRLFVVAPPAIHADWRTWAERVGVPLIGVASIGKIRTGKTPFGKWLFPAAKRSWRWTLGEGALVVFDEAHLLSGIATQSANVLIGTVDQGQIHLMLSATLIGNPLKAYAIGYSTGLHRLSNFASWCKDRGVVDTIYGPAFRPSIKRGEFADDIMREIRESMGIQYGRIDKNTVPGFPEIQNIPTFVQTKELKIAEDKEYSMEARQRVELLKVEPTIERVRASLDEGFSVAVFMNFRETMVQFHLAFPEAAMVFGGQVESERRAGIEDFQANRRHVILVMSQAGGAGLSLHDLNGRPRVSYIFPSSKALDFVQILGRIHRAGSLSKAINYIILAEGVPVERRIRRNLDKNLANLNALNDSDLGTTYHRAAPSVPAEIQTNSVDEGSNESNLPSPMSETALALVPPPAPTTLVPAQHVEGDHAKRKHARCSPSKLKPLGICPSYEPDEEAEVHPVTLRGTAMHEAMETEDDSKLDEQEVTLVNMVRQGLQVDIEWAESIIMEKHIKTHDRDVQGFVDLTMIGPKKPSGWRQVRIRDYKFGWNPVESPEKNPQAIAYVVGVFLEYDDVDEINFQFYIPRLDLVLDYTFHRSQLDELKMVITLIATRVRERSGKEFNVVESNCLYCGRKATCQPLIDKSLAILRAQPESATLPIPATLLVGQMQDPVIMAQAMDLARIVSDWAVQVNRQGLRLRQEMGVEIPGYDYVERQAKRDIVDPAGAFQVLQTFGLTQTEYLAAAKVSITSVMTSIREHAPAGTTKVKYEKDVTNALMDAGCLTRGAPFFVLQKSKKSLSKAQQTLDETTSGS